MKIVVGISGASGPIYGIRLLEVLKEYKEIETHLVISEAALRTIELETDWQVKALESMASFVYDINDLEARISSGSFEAEGMIIAPCSVKTLSALANSYNQNLLVRAGDVTLKERRKLVILFRETPLHLGHIRLMEQFTGAGGIVFPPVPAFYHKPNTIDDIINHTIGKVLDIFRIKHNLFKRWKAL